jgi:hypothetical protein
MLLQSLAVDLGAVATFAFLLRRDLKARDKQVPSWLLPLPGTRRPLYHRGKPCAQPGLA